MAFDVSAGVILKRGRSHWPTEIMAVSGLVVRVVISDGVFHLEGRAPRAEHAETVTAVLGVANARYIAVFVENAGADGAPLPGRPSGAFVVVEGHRPKASSRGPRERTTSGGVLGNPRWRSNFRMMEAY